MKNVKKLAELKHKLTELSALDSTSVEALDILESKIELEERKLRKCVHEAELCRKKVLEGKTDELENLRDIVDFKFPRNFKGFDIKVGKWSDVVGEVLYDWTGGRYKSVKTFLDGSEIISIEVER